MWRQEEPWPARLANQQAPGPRKGKMERGWQRHRVLSSVLQTHVCAHLRKNKYTYEAMPLPVFQSTVGLEPGV